MRGTKIAIRDAVAKDGVAALGTDAARATRDALGPVRT